MQQNNDQERARVRDTVQFHLRVAAIMEHRRMHVFCDVCGEEANVNPVRDTEAARDGWFIGGGETLCPKCK